LKIFYEGFVIRPSPDDEALSSYGRSKSPAAPIPPPMHMVTSPNFASRRFIS